MVYKRPLKSREGEWHLWGSPPIGRGVRTQFSDDFLWLPLAICRYIETTGDTGVLDERIPFLVSRPLRDDEESNYDLPQVSDDIGTLYQHGVRALHRGFRYGVHGLPLMGCGDWNDGMNAVGEKGVGEAAGGAGADVADVERGGQFAMVPRYPRARRVV